MSDSDISTLVPDAAQVAPRRNPGLIARIAAAFLKADPSTGPQPSEQASTQTGKSDPQAGYADQFFTFNYDVDRRAIYRDADEMDSSSDEVSTALDIIADNASTSEDGVQIAFEIHSDDAQVQEILDHAVATSGLKKKTRQIFRNLAKYGDMFAEPEFNEDLELVDVRQLPPPTIERNEDEYGNLKLAAPKMGENGQVANERNTCAFEQFDPDTQKLVATFYPWQVAHGRLGNDGFRKYGRSLLRVARLTWRKLKSLEEALIIGRLTRDLMKLVFYIDTTGLAPRDKKAVLKEFRESVSMRTRVDQKRENPFSVLTDYYLSDGYVRVGGQPMPMRTRVEPIDPKNAGQHDITDIEFLHRKLLMDLRVPAEHMQWGTESAPGILTQKDVQYVRWLRSLQQEAGHALEQIFNLVLILNGVDPSKVEYAITWPALRATDEAAAAQTYLAYAQGDQLYMQEGVLAPSYVQKHRFNLDDEEIAELDEEIEEIAQRDLDQAVEIAQKTQPVLAPAGQATSGAPAGGSSTSSGPQDRDGRRKGDEGRDRNGKRIAPTKSKKNTPSGSGSRTRKRRATVVNESVVNEHRLGAIDPVNRILLERMKRDPELRPKLIAMEARTNQIVLERVQAEPVDVAAPPPKFDSTIVGMWVDPMTARKLAIPGGEEPGDMHVTLAYLGKTDALGLDDGDRYEKLVDAVRSVANRPALEGSVSGLARFSDPDNDMHPVVALVDSPDLPAFRQNLVEALAAAGFPAEASHGFTPHITLQYVHPHMDTPIEDVPNLPLHFDFLTIAASGMNHHIPLGEREEVTQDTSTGDLGASLTVTSTQTGKGGKVTSSTSTQSWNTRDGEDKKKKRKKKADGTDDESDDESK